MTNPQTIRDAIVNSLPIQASEYGSAPEPQYVYVPPSHLKALRLECNLVIGGRGVGKSFWCNALQSAPVRTILGKTIPELKNAVVVQGYGVGSQTDRYPDPETFGQLLGKSFDAYAIWRAVVARWAAQELTVEIPKTTWLETVDWVHNNPEPMSQLLEKCNQSFEQRGLSAILVFDALDLTGTDWKTMDQIVRGLLRVILRLKGFRRLSGKVFLRTDQFDGRPGVKDFPDASKLMATRVELTWFPNDLHGLLWQYLCNGPGEHGETLRSVYREITASDPIPLAPDVWGISESAKREGTLQRDLFHATTGPYMGKDRRRGIPYVWSVSHLADGRGHTSPRSFLAAIRAAAEDSQQKYPEHNWPLHYEGIKRGVQKASEIRVSELEEDYPWVKQITTPLRALSVPCPFEAVEQRWIAQLGDHPKKMTFSKLPPEHYEDGWKGVREDLVKLGIFNDPMPDGRINMPDLFRVGFGLGRRGGVKPLPKSKGAVS